MKQKDGEQVPEVNSTAGLEQSSVFQNNLSEYYDKMGKTSYGSKTVCVDEVVSRVKSCHIHEDRPTAHDLNIILGDLRLDGTSDGEIHQPHSTVVQLEENQLQQNHVVNRVVEIQVIEEDAIPDNLVKLEAPSCDDSEEEDNPEASKDDSEVLLLDRGPMNGIPVRCSIAVFPSTSPGTGENCPGFRYHVPVTQPPVASAKRGIDDGYMELPKYFRPLDEPSSLGGMSGCDVPGEVSISSGSCVKMVSQTHLSGGTVHIPETTQPHPGQRSQDINYQLTNNATNCTRVLQNPKAQANGYQHDSLSLQQRCHHDDSYRTLNKPLKCCTELLGSPIELLGSPIELLGSHRELLGYPTELLGPHRELLGSPTELLGSHRELLGSPTELLGSHRELLGYPTELLGSHRELLGSPAELLGSHRELLGSPAELLGSHRELLGSHRKLLGSHRELLGSPAELLGSHRELLGSHRELLGSPTELLGSHRELLGSPAELLGSHRELLGSHRELLGSPTELLGSHRELLGSPAELLVPSPDSSSPPPSNLSVWSLDSGVFSPLSDTFIRYPIQSSTVISCHSQDGPSTRDDSCSDENEFITKNISDLYQTYKDLQQLDGHFQITPPRDVSGIPNCATGTKVIDNCKTTTSSENVTHQNCQGLRHSTHSCSQQGTFNISQQGAFNNSQQWAFNNSQQGAFNNSQQWASNDSQQWASNDSQQWASNDSQQWASNDSQQWASNDSQQWASNDSQQWASNDSQQWASNDSQQWASNDSQQWASNDSQQWASNDSQQWASNDSQHYGSKRICSLKEVPRPSVLGTPESTRVTASTSHPVNNQGQTANPPAQAGSQRLPVQVIIFTQMAPQPTPSSTHYRHIYPKTERTGHTVNAGSPGGSSNPGHRDKTSSMSPAEGEDKKVTYDEKVKNAKQCVANISLDILRCVDEDGENLLHGTVCQSDHILVQALLERVVQEGLADMINAQNRRGQTPLYLATSINKSETVRVLVEHGADANLLAASKTSCGAVEMLAAIHCASNRGEKYLGTLQAVLAAPGIKLDLVNSTGHTALNCAILAHGKVDTDNKPINSVPIIQALIRAGADPNTQVQQSGKTALMYALESRDLDLVEKTFQLIEPSKLSSFLKTKAFDGSSCIRIANSLKTHLDPAAVKRLSTCLKPRLRRESL
ncbi:hypothetical protein BsWGS_28528 [Bradybaena similaris]